MLPASNRGAGMNLGFPDVCLTPAGPATVPVPYPNIALNAQAQGFSPVVKVSMMPALNVGSKIPMTSGDEAGSANPTIKGAGAYVMGNPIVSIDRLPAINLACPTTGNNMNNALGAVLVPSAVNVMFCRAGEGDRLGAEATARRVDAAELELLGGEMREPAVSVERRGAIAVVRILTCAPGLAVDVHRKLTALSGSVQSMVIDLRGNPGGELEAAARLAETLLPAGALIATVAEGDGDTWRLVAHGQPLSTLPLVVLVDAHTASAAELLAATLQAHARAIVVGAPTHGKRVVHRLLANGGELDRVVSATWTAGPAEASAPVEPDLRVDDDHALAVAVSIAAEIAAAVSG